MEPHAGLVPVPRGSELQPGALWPAERIAEALCGEGFGERVLPCLARQEAVPKSSHSKGGERTKAPRHYETMSVDRDLREDPKLLVLVDDVVTLGNTLFGAASRLREGFPDAEIRAFAAARTLGLQPEVDRVIEPYAGTFYRRPNGWIDRDP